jgi:choice-of-anchor A domain-containing protein
MICSAAFLHGTAALAQTCPENLCTCLGSTASYAIVGAKNVAMAPAKLVTKESGYAYVQRFASSADDAVCGLKGTFKGGPGSESSIGGDLVLTNVAGKVAGSFKGYRSYGSPQPGVNVSGDLATGGGKIGGPSNVVVTGTTDATGASLKVSPCQSAIDGLESRSDQLSALTPTQTLAKIALRGADADINAGNGVNVINVESIALRPKAQKYSGYVSLITSSLNINLLPGTTSVIVNVAKAFSVGKECSVNVLGGDSSKVLINVLKKGASIGKNGSVDPAILAARGGISIRLGGSVGNAFGKKVALKGASVSDDLICP